MSKLRVPKAGDRRIFPFPVRQPEVPEDLQGRQAGEEVPMTEREYMLVRAISSIKAAKNALLDILPHSMPDVIPVLEYDDVWDLLIRWERNISAEINIGE